jgi:DNA-binding MarR family transcriptional regulator
MAEPSLTPALVAAVFRAAGALRRNGDLIARTVGQTQARWQVLSVVSGRDDWTAPRVAYELGISRQAVQRVADELVADGLMRTQRNPYHRRSVRFQLTEEGVAALAALGEAAADWHAELDALIRPADAETTRHVLRVLIRAPEGEGGPFSQLDSAP